MNPIIVKDQDCKHVNIIILYSYRNAQIIKVNIYVKIDLVIKIT